MALYFECRINKNELLQTKIDMPKYGVDISIKRPALSALIGWYHSFRCCYVQTAFFYVSSKCINFLFIICSNFFFIYII